MAQSLQVERQLTHLHGDYGFDAPYVPIMLGLIGIAFLAFGFINILWLGAQVIGVICLVYGAFMLLSTASYVYTTRRGKFEVWAEILAQLGLHGDEQVLDMGCGRGAVLVMAAKLLPRGKAIGVDLWKSSDQSGNAVSVTQRNAELEGVAERVELSTADMRQLPFADASFDVVLSSLAIHNISSLAGRDQAIDEAVRVLKPGGKVVIADIRQTQRYTERLRELGMLDVSSHMLDWRFWYGGPWMATKLVRARKPS